MQINFRKLHFSLSHFSSKNQKTKVTPKKKNYYSSTFQTKPNIKSKNENLFYHPLFNLLHIFNQQLFNPQPNASIMQRVYFSFRSHPGPAPSYHSV